MGETDAAYIYVAWGGGSQLWRLADAVGWTVGIRRGVELKFKIAGINGPGWLVVVCVGLGCLGAGGGGVVGGRASQLCGPNWKLIFALTSPMTNRWRMRVKLTRFQQLERQLIWN